MKRNECPLIVPVPKKKSSETGKNIKKRLENHKNNPFLQRNKIEVNLSHNLSENTKKISHLTLIDLHAV